MILIEQFAPLKTPPSTVLSMDRPAPEAQASTFAPDSSSDIEDTLLNSDKIAYMSALLKRVGV